MKLTRKSIGRIAASFVATAMLATTLALVPVSADETSTPITSMPVTKTVTTDGDTYAPATTFNFKVTNGNSVKNFMDGTNENGVDVSEGVTGGLGTLQQDGTTYGFSIQSTPDTTKDTADSYDFEGSMAVNIGAFHKAGVYHYVVEEVTPTNQYEGINYSTEKYDVYVYVVNANTAGTEFKIDAVIAFQNNKKVKKVVFTNNYGSGDNDSTHDVTITKKVEGTLATMGDTFEFTVGVNGATDEAYKVVYTQNGSEVTTFVTSGDTITIDGIGNNDTITIYGLTENDTYTVTENDGETQGYTVSDSDATTDAGTVSGKVTSDGATATITNTKDASTPTGIMMDIAPYALLVIVAGAACFVFLRKRNKD